ncbi:MAG TPA: dienelactone hydrolase family protein [Pseudonocardiaceae bacterium]|jgi:carboxymethylenebutenolidase|nr:dienelactone hydrolase family protein [Pseudonocardiaceae bacterium]
MTEFERYVIEEHVEDFNDHLISRRELLRRVTLMTGSTAATLALLQTLGCSTTPSGTPAAPASRTSTPSQPFAMPPEQPTADGVTVRPDDPRIEVRSLQVKGPDDAPLISYHARPSGSAPSGGVLVVHENRGLVEHIKDVVRRVATAGYSALAVDLLSREGGADRLSDPAAYAAALSKRDVGDMVGDLRQALSALSGTGVSDKLGATGFCFGGGLVWNALATSVAMKAAVPFYGPPPQNPTGLAGAKAAVFAVYAERDTRITSTKDAVEEQLRKTGKPYQVKVYPGVDHAFHNDTGPRYNATQAAAAWLDTINWFRQHVR